MFFFNDTATTEIYTLSLHDALPICAGLSDALPAPVRDHGRDRPADADLPRRHLREARPAGQRAVAVQRGADRKSTRLNSSHAQYLVCRLLLEKKLKKEQVALQHDRL